MFDFLKKTLAMQLARMLPGLRHATKKVAIQKIRLMLAADISDSFVFGEGSSISLEGKFKKFSVGEDVHFKKFCNILLFPDSSLVIDDKVFFNNYCSLNCLGKIEIGTNTIFGEGVKIYDHNHRYHFEQKGDLKVARDEYDIGFVKLGKNCWIGSNVTILNKVEIGDNVIIGANCLIYKSVPSNTIVKHKEDLVITKNDSQ